MLEIILVGQVGRISLTTFSFFHSLYFHISKLHRIAKYNCPFNPFTTESFHVFETFSAYKRPIEKLSIAVIIINKLVKTVLDFKLLDLLEEVI